MLSANSKIIAHGTVTPPDYQAWDTDRLRADLQARDLPTDGDREALILRLTVDNQRRLA